MADERAEQERQSRLKDLANEQRILRETADQLKREREALIRRKQERADEYQTFIKSASQSRAGFYRDTGFSATSIPLPEHSKDFLQEQRRYREALLQQISQERQRKAENTAEEKRQEKESVQKIQQQHSISVSTTASLVQSQQSNLRKSLLAQMKEKESQRDLEKSRKEVEMQYLKREEARYQEIQRQRVEYRQQQTKAMAAALASQTKVRKSKPESASTSLQLGERKSELYPCSKCNRLLARPLLTAHRPAWT